MSDSFDPINLNFKAASILLNVPASTLSRWVRQGKIPSRRQGSEILFLKTDLCNWAREHDLPLHEANGSTTEKRVNRYDQLILSLKHGGIHTITADSKLSLFRILVSRLKPVLNGDPQAITEALMEREAIATTALGRGFAIPHPRMPERFGFSQSVTGLFLLDPPLDFNAPDQIPVFLVFALFTPDCSTHLSLMALISQFLRQPGIAQFLKGCPPLDEILNRLEVL